MLVDKEYIISMLKTYGPMTQRQLELLCQVDSKKVFDSTIQVLKSSRRLFDINGGYYLGLSSFDKPNENIIRALWVFLYFIKDVKPMHHRSGDYPGQVFFVKGDCQYQIMVVQDGLEFEVSLLPPKHPNENKKYIFVVTSFDREKYIEPYLPKNATCVLATLSQNGISNPTPRFKVPDCQQGGIQN